LEGRRQEHHLQPVKNVLYIQTLDAPAKHETETETVPTYIDLLAYLSMLIQATEPQKVAIPGPGPTAFNGTTQLHRLPR